MASPLSCYPLSSSSPAPLPLSRSQLSSFVPVCRSQCSSSSSTTSKEFLVAPLSRRLSLILAVSPVSFKFPVSPTTSSSVQASEFAEDEFDEEEQRVVRLFEEATRSVVCIKDVELSKPTTSKNSFPNENGANVEGTGSGFVWDKFGHIVTNYHVVAKLAKDASGRQQSQVSLLCPNGDVVVKVAELIGIDAAHDLAVLKIGVPEELLQPIPLASSKDVRVGQSCFAIGNPYGYEHTLTGGVISGLGREIPSPAGRPISGAIQTDASINAGNSGGPLLDSFGHVIGINTATFTRQGSGMSSGVNFAIPIDLALRIVPHLIVDGTLSTLNP